MQTKEQRLEFIKSLSSAAVEILVRDWPIWGRRSQHPPPGSWRNWLMLGGRGAGKTRAGAQWIHALAMKDGHFSGSSGGRVALIGETLHDVRSVMIEGDSGLLSVDRNDRRPKWHASRRLLEWPNGTLGHVFSATDPDGLRGSQFGAIWSDEIAKWPYLDATWSMIQFCLRLGDRPKLLATTTPRPLRLIRKMLSDNNTVITRSTAEENSHFLSPDFLGYLRAEFGGTWLGRQEIDGEIVEDRQGALWRRSQLESSRVREFPRLERIIIAVVPPASSNANSDACGIIVVGRANGGECYVLEDATIQGVAPEVWSQRVVSTFYRWEADCVVAEVNQGGEMVTTVLAMVDNALPVRPVRASRGKWLRAEPVALLYARGKVFHVGALPELEDEMCNFCPDGFSEGKSPDRLDALVWAVHSLTLASSVEPKIRSA